MRVASPEYLNKMFDECKPYLTESIPVAVKDSAPPEIKDKFEEWKRLYGELVASCSELPI